MAGVAAINEKIIDHGILFCPNIMNCDFLKILFQKTIILNLICTGKIKIIVFDTN